MKNRIEELTKELLDLLKEGNVTIEEVSKDPTFLSTHPDLDRVIDIVSELDEAFKNG